MKITWHGHSCFTIQGNDATVITDPFSEKIGLQVPRLKGEIVTVSADKPAFNNVGAVDGEPLICSWPGEYEKKDAQVIAIPIKKDDEVVTLVFHILIDKIRICHLGSLGMSLTDELLEQIGEVDILLVPVGGGDILNAKKAHEAVEAIDPKIVIPMQYKVEGLEEELEPVTPFLKEIGKDFQPQPFFQVKKAAELPMETTEFFVLEVK